MLCTAMHHLSMLTIAAVAAESMAAHPDLMPTVVRHVDAAHLPRPSDAHCNPVFHAAEPLQTLSLTPTLA